MNRYEVRSMYGALRGCSWGAATVSRRILFVQTVPAALGLAALAMA